MKKKYYSEATMVAHQSAQDLFEIGAIDVARMREFDKMCLIPESEPAEELVPATKKHRDHPQMPVGALTPIQNIAFSLLFLG